MLDLDLIPLLLVVGIGFAIVVVKARQPPVVRVEVQFPSFVMVETQVMAHNLIEEGRHADELKLLRKRAGLRRREAKEAVDALHAGRVLPEWPMPDKPDLSTRVGDLKRAGRRKKAVFLTRIETEMNTADAEVFVDSI
jgi:hypothetical protein